MYLKGNSGKNTKIEVVWGFIESDMKMTEVSIWRGYEKMENGRWEKVTPTP